MGCRRCSDHGRKGPYRGRSNAIRAAGRPGGRARQVATQIGRPASRPPAVARRLSPAALVPRRGRARARACAAPRPRCAARSESGPLEALGVGKRHLAMPTPLDRRVEVVEARLPDAGGQFGADPAARPALLDTQRSVGLRHRCDDRLDIQRPQRAQVDHLGCHPSVASRSATASARTVAYPWPAMVMSLPCRATPPRPTRPPPPAPRRPPAQMARIRAPAGQTALASASSTP
jgi:hypothetical protein